MQHLLDQPGSDLPQPATEKQLHFARLIAGRNRVLLPWAVQQDRRAISEWIGHQQATAPAAATADSHPTSRQVAFAEKLARIKRRAVPEECFRDRSLLSRWIDRNR